MTRLNVSFLLVSYYDVDSHTSTDGAAYYATTQGTGVKYQTGGDVLVRSYFVQAGTLNDTTDSNFRAVDDQFPILAFSHDLGTISSTAQPVVIGVGHARDPVVQFVVADGMQPRSPYYVSQFATPIDSASYQPINHLHHILTKYSIDFSLSAGILIRTRHGRHIRRTNQRGRLQDFCGLRGNCFSLCPTSIRGYRDHCWQARRWVIE